MTFSADTGGMRRWLVLGSLLAVYLIWGSTYLALRFLVEDFPPFLGNAIRMGVAGAILFVWVRARGGAAPTRNQWLWGFVIGGTLFVGGLGLVAWAELLGIGSGLAATAVATVPLWASVVSGLFGRWPARSEWLGVGVGIAGVVLLFREGDFQAAPDGIVLMVVAPMLWALGSVWSNHVDLPRGSMSAAVQMLGGGAALTLAGWAGGETVGSAPGMTGWLALAYLIGPGSLLAFSAYAYLLRTVRPGLATSYSYVNPVVAVALGVTLGNETLTGEAWIALPMILLAVGLLARGRG